MENERSAIGLVLDYLSKKYGCSLEAEYYTQIDEWKKWWRGFYEPFHRIREWNGVKTITRDLYSLRMAKKVCEDWASILLNEKTEIVLEDASSSSYLIGEDGLGGVLGDNDFWRQGNALIEKAFATGTGAFVVKLTGFDVNEEGAIVRGDAKVKLEYLDAPCIVPLSVHADKITEAAFVSSVTERGKKYIYVESHALENGEYVIKNDYFRSNNGVLVPESLPSGVAPSIRTGSTLPWFALISPNLVNNIWHNNGLGISIFANAIDNLKGIDLAFNNFCRDFMLGGKKVFYNKELIRTDKDGRKITPDDMAQQLFMQIGDDITRLDADQLIHEFNPDLRVEGNQQGLQAQLNYLSFKCGFGVRRYQFKSDTVQTATEYMGSQQEMIQNANKHYIAVERALQTLTRTILHIGREFCGQPVNPDTGITVNFEDSYIIDKESERQRDLQEIRDGIVQKYEYRMKWFGEDEETAKKMAAPDQSDDDWMGFSKEE